MLQKYIQGGLSDIKTLTLEDGLKWASGDQNPSRKKIYRDGLETQSIWPLAPQAFKK